MKSSEILYEAVRLIQTRGLYIGTSDTLFGESVISSVYSLSSTPLAERQKALDAIRKEVGTKNLPAWNDSSSKEEVTDTMLRVAGQLRESGD